MTDKELRTRLIRGTPSYKVMNKESKEFFGGDYNGGFIEKLSFKMICGFYPDVNMEVNKSFKSLLNDLPYYMFVRHHMLLIPDFLSILIDRSVPRGFIRFLIFEKRFEGEEEYLRIGYRKDKPEDLVPLRMYDEEVAKRTYIGSLFLDGISQVIISFAFA